MTGALDRRRSGVLLHPTALCGAAGEPADAGALGAASRAFVDWLVAAGATVWQMLPLGPVGADRSPYWVRSDQAGNPALIDRREAPDPGREQSDFEAYCESQRDWLEDYALFAVLGQAHEAAPWWRWPEPLRERRPQALREARARYAAALQAVRVEQWQFARQWAALRRYAGERGIRLYGDLPIYLAPDSVATWTQREQFQLAADGQPAVRAGVPPDYFAADGQLWGNPLYDWQQAQSDGFRFWRRRLATLLERFDLVRIDHFRGLAGYWAVPAAAHTAREGAWMSAPGMELLEALRAEFGPLPVVAEDLGVITPDVDDLRRAFGMPGMRVLQFGFDGAAGNPHLPYNYTHDTVAYTGTHDNDTVVGWYRSLDEPTARRVADFLGIVPGGVAMDGVEVIAQGMVRAVLASVAKLAVVPVQDLLALGSEARINVPGTVGDNWQWRLDARRLTSEVAARHRALNAVFGRL